jgi:Peptidase family M28
MGGHDRGLWGTVLLAALGLAGCASGPLAPLRYELVDPAPAGLREPPATAATVAAAIDLSTLEQDVRFLASPALQGRRRGTEGNRVAREHIIRRLQAAGLSPLFGDSFEQPTPPTDPGAAPHATNVGAMLRAPDPDAGWVVLVAHYDHLGVVRGAVHPGADDNASSVALLLAVADALGRQRPTLERHVVLLFPDAEEPPDIRTAAMGSAWFWRKPPLPLHRLHLAVVFDLMGGRVPDELEAARLGDAVFVLGGEADPGLAALVHDLGGAEGIEPLPLSLPMIEAMPYLPWRRFARSDYHGLREHGRRPFLLLTTGRTETYHTPHDTPDTLDYRKLGRLTRWVTRLIVHATGAGELHWTDLRADACADARAVLRLHDGIGEGARFPWLLRRALRADRQRVTELLRSWEAGTRPTPEDYRALQLAGLRVQAALWHPSGWWFALW